MNATTIPHQEVKSNLVNALHSVNLHIVHNRFEAASTEFDRFCGAMTQLKRAIEEQQEGLCSLQELQTTIDIMASPIRDIITQKRLHENPPSR